MKTKGFKKVLSVLLVLVMAIQLLPALNFTQTEAATEYVRIKNVWQNTYIYQNGDKAVYGNVDSADQRSQWQIINVSDGTVRIRNRATGDYMHIENLRGYVQCGDINEEWCSARWLKTDAGNGEVRFGNYWQRSQYMHVENLNGSIQSGNIYDVWSSAKWVIEKVTVEETEAPTTTKAPETTTEAPTTTKAPETTTEAPTTTKAPETTTEAPTTTKAPETTTQVQAEYGNPDLVVTEIYCEPDTITAGKTVTFKAKVTNQGTASTKAGTVVGVRFSVDSLNAGVYTWSDTYTSSVKPGESIIVTANGGSNGNTWTATNGNHTVYAWVDDVNRINENNENNNTKTQVINVTTETTTEAPTTTKAPETTTEAPTTTKAPETTTEVPTTTQAAEYGNPDLVVTEIYCDPDDITTGTGVTFKAKVTNQGTASTKAGTVVGVRFSVDSLNAGVYTWSDTYTSSIKPGESVTVTANGGSNGSKWNASYGTHTVYAWVDDVDRITESNDNNNTTTKTINVANASSGSTGGSTGGSNTGSTGKGTVIGYPTPAGKATSSSVSMTANGVNVGVFDTTVNNSHAWVDSYYPPLSTAEVGIFDFSGSAEVVMTVNYRVNSATIRPVGDGITPNITYNGNTSYVSFTINKPGQYSVEFNNDLTDATMIFASEIEAEPTGNVIKISSGQAYYGNINVGSGQTLYIEGGGAIFGRVFCASNSTVCGRGIIDGSHLDTWKGSNGQYPMSIEGVSNVHVSGVAVLNSNCWNYQIYNSSDVHLDNIKIVSARPNGDGVSIQSSSYVYIDDSFIRTWDDGVVLKNYSYLNTHDVYVNNCRFWTDLAQTMEIGFETNAGYGGTNGSPSIYNAKFENITIFHALHKAPISIHNGDNAEIKDITWSNITIEDCNVGQGDGWYLWLDFTNVPAGNIPGAYSGWTHNYARGTIHDITLKNINVLSSSTTNYRIWANGNGDIYNIYAENAFTYGQ